MKVIVITELATLPVRQYCPATVSLAVIIRHAGNMKKVISFRLSIIGLSSNNNNTA